MPACGQRFNFEAQHRKLGTAGSSNYIATSSCRSGLRSPQHQWRQRRRRQRLLVCSAATQQHMVVVGGGVGGLATAGRLAREGMQVTLLEKNPEVGGRVQSVELGGCRFDTGPSLLLFKDKYEEAFRALGTSLEAHVDVRQVAPAAYRVFFEGGTHLDLLNDPEAMAAQLESVEAGAGAAYPAFLSLARWYLELGVPHFIDKDFAEPGDVARLAGLLPLLPGVNPMDLLGQHDARLGRFFRDPRLRAMFTFQDLYVGLTPRTAPAVFSLLAGTELTDGVHYPLGGFQKVRDGLLHAAQQCGVEVRTQAEVAAITTADSAEGPRVTGVTLMGGERIAADVVVCNRDLPAAYPLLDPSSGNSSSDASGTDDSTHGSAASSSSSSAAAVGSYARRRHEQLGRLKYSAGVIAFNWALSRRLDPPLLHHNVFLSSEWEKSWQLAGRPDELRPHPNFYLHCPARTDPSAAPAGGDSLMVLLPVASMQHMAPSSSGSRAGSSSSGAGSGEGYGALVEAGRQRVLAALQAAGAGDVGAAITHELVITPADWEQRYGLRYGAAFGLAHGLDQLSVFRPANQDPKVCGLYFVGASTRPGNGVPLCLISAKLTAERVLKDLSRAWLFQAA